MTSGNNQHFDEQHGPTGEGTGETKGTEPEAKRAPKLSLEKGEREDRTAKDAPDEAPEETSEEEVLRRLLHDSVRDIRPSPKALDHLQRAVPARRAHRRQALIGVAASLLLAVTAVPALIHTANTASSSSDRSENTASGETNRGGKGDAESSPTKGPSDKVSSGSKGKGDKGKGSGKHKSPPGTTSSGSSAGGGPSNTFAIASPTCTAAQLSQSPASVGPADGSGRVYGTFRVVNVSSDKCTVEAPGQVTAAVQGGADPSAVHAVPHTAGDASGLPDASGESIVLQPGGAYVVKFGWVPESGTTGCSQSSDPASGGSVGDASGGTGNGGEPSGEDPSANPPGSVQVTYAPDGGASAATGQVDGVCAGTVYYTPPMADA